MRPLDVRGQVLEPGAGGGRAQPGPARPGRHLEGVQVAGQDRDVHRFAGGEIRQDSLELLQLVLVAHHVQVGDVDSQGEA